ncbi:hypothetical protein L198_06689 [Cryptococcus wingfieldii CBS 7118]|uniref:Uncharacterized protein n=1 Tax=Cryptococcus wingfieldii CBS 7118 TaxID=1295528 RepID=A0A1E3IIR1_9TREE|nr:hypothetical protein L198_06689 [Cryptococcus wingfieldii CBS 7118]ODN88418.1 hypothetical protein L198_06689 [Cryptococcus wingfieldii CBS 7118]
MSPPIPAEVAKDRDCQMSSLEADPKYDLALPPELISLIFTFYASSTIPGSKAFTDLLCLSRAIHDENINRAYDRITLTEDNVLAFFRPWIAWAAKVKKSASSNGRSIMSQMRLDNTIIYPRAWMGYAENFDRKRSITFADTRALLETCQFKNENGSGPFGVFSYPSEEEFRKSPFYLLNNLHHVAFPSSLFISTSTSQLYQIAWEKYRRWKMYETSYVRAQHVCIELPLGPLPQVAFDGLNDMLKNTMANLKKLTVHNCSVTSDLPLLAIDPKVIFEIFMKSPRDTGMDEAHVEAIEIAQQDGLVDRIVDIFSYNENLSSCIVHHLEPHGRDPVSNIIQGLEGEGLDDDIPGLVRDEKLLIFTNEDCVAHEKVECLCGLEKCR